MRILSCVLLLVGCRDTTKVVLEPSQEETNVYDFDGDGYVGDDDCDDNNALIHNNAEEVCDGLDNNCDGLVDDGVLTSFYADADGDGYGNEEGSVQSCETPSGYVPNGSDCDDSNAGIYPGADESCDGLDNNCNDEIDEGLGVFYFVDADGDGFGNDQEEIEACELRDGLSAIGGDCNDDDATVSPVAIEVCDEIDNNCDGIIDVGEGTIYYPDADNDGYGNGNAAIEACAPPVGYIEVADDCDDSNANINPSADEVCDEVDNNCNGLVDDDDSTVTDVLVWYLDYDGDGYGDPSYSNNGCVGPTDYVDNDDDCNDLDATINPGVTEVCDEIDNDCNGTVDEGVQSTWYLDYDGDGFGNGNYPLYACTQPAESSLDASDCDDTDADIYPGADEYCDNVDQDCDGITMDDDSLDALEWFVDTDGDGYGDDSSTVFSCNEVTGSVDNPDDCDDSDADIYPGSHQTEVPFDGIDPNCDGKDYCIDLNCDAWPDIALPSYYGSSLGYDSDSFVFYGTTNGYGTEVETLDTEGVSNFIVDDFNSDGYLDILAATYYSYASGYDAPSQIFWGSDSGFSNTNLTLLEGHAVHNEPCVEDINEDGYPDILLPLYYSSSGYQLTSYLYWGSSMGYDSSNRTELEANGPFGCLIEDIDQDGFIDLYLPSYAGGTYESYIYWGSSTGDYDSTNRAELYNYYIRESYTTDIDGDGNIEIVAANLNSYAGYIDVTGQTASAELIYYGNVYDMKTADLDNDGDNDVVMCQYISGSSYSTTAAIYWNVSGSLGTTVSYLPAYSCRNLHIMDADQDGYKDVLFVNQGQGSTSSYNYTTVSQVYYGSSSGFDPSDRDDLLTYGSYHASVADIDGDDFPDILLSSYYNGTTYDVDSILYYGSANGYSSTNTDLLPTKGIWGNAVIVGAE